MKPWARKEIFNGTRKDEYRERRSLLLKRSRELYVDRTKAEDVLWKELKARKLGVRFRCQHRFPPYYIVDFVCMTHKLIIELDGSSHDGREEYDARRTQYLNSIGFTVIRFDNRDVLTNMPSVLAKIRELLATVPVKKSKRQLAIKNGNIGVSEYF